MNYEKIIQMIKYECSIQNVSAYKLAQLSSLPISTIYGILHQNNKAQFDTLCAILHALKLEIILRPLADKAIDADNQENKNMLMLEKLSEEKQEVIYRLAEWLSER